MSDPVARAEAVLKRLNTRCASWADPSRPLALPRCGECTGCLAQEWLDQAPSSLQPQRFHAIDLSTPHEPRHVLVDAGRRLALAESRNADHIHALANVLNDHPDRSAFDTVLNAVLQEVPF